MVGKLFIVKFEISLHISKTMVFFILINSNMDLICSLQSVSTTRNLNVLQRDGVI